MNQVVALDELAGGNRSTLDGTGIRLLEGSILDPAGPATSTSSWSRRRPCTARTAS